VTERFNPTVAQWGFAKYGALRTLASAIVQLKNWPEVWPHLRRRGCTTEFPTLRFRRGLILQHRPEDLPCGQYYDVFRHKIYRQYKSEPRHWRGQPGLGYPAANRPLAERPECSLFTQMTKAS
jgi:hypothetical protein